MLRALTDSSAPWDILIIGGGATGLGTAVDAASRGYRTLLLEQRDFASGTSSRSTKLIHAGVDLGGTVLNYAQVKALKKKNGRICGAVARDLETDTEYELLARAVVNATGVFADRVRQLDEPAASRMIAPSQGAHIVLERS